MELQGDIGKGLLLVLLLLGYGMQAQDLRPRQDFGGWLGFRLEKELPKDFEVSLEQQLRTWRNSTRIEAYWAELGLKYEINKNFSLAGNARYVHDANRWKRPENALRYNLDLQFKTKIQKSWHFYYRARYQQKFAYPFGAINFKLISKTRHKIKLQHKYKKHHKFYVATELFVRAQPLRQTYFDQLRFSVGDKIKTKVGQFDVGLGYEMNLQPQEAFSFYYFKIVHTLSL